MPFQNQDQPEKRIVLGKIHAPHGVKGLVKILPFGDDPALLEHVENFKVTLKNPQGKYYLAQIEGVNDRDAAEALKGTELFISRDKLPEIEDENTFYFEDLVGLTTVDENGKETGKVIAVHNFGAGDLLEIQPLSGESYMLPFTDENVGDVDLPGKRVFISHSSES